jgi:hypothetical protein
MRYISNLVCCVLLVILVTGSAFAQDPSISISGPILGFIADSSGLVIRPILGVLGASLLGDPLQLGSGIRNALISPKQDYALAIREGSGELVRIGLTAGSVSIDAISGARIAADVIAISPGGTAAAAYQYGDRILQTFAQLTDAPRVVFEMDTSDIPGRLQGLAISDDGRLALLNLVTGDDASLWVLSATGARFLVTTGQPSAVIFLLGRHDAVIGDDRAQEVFMVMGLDDTMARVPVASNVEGFDAISGVAASDDGQRVVITTKNSGNVTLVDRQTGVRSVLPCDCQSTGLQRLKGAAAFRLSDPSTGPIVLLDASSAEPRVVVMPATPVVTSAPAVEGVQPQ